MPEIMVICICELMLSFISCYFGTSEDKHKFILF